MKQNYICNVQNLTNKKSHHVTYGTMIPKAINQPHLREKNALKCNNVKFTS